MTAAAPPAETRFGPGRVAAIVGGGIVCLIALALVLGGLALVVGHAFVRDDDGYFNLPERGFSTSTYALIADDLDLGGGWLVDELAGRVRIRARLTGGEPVFVGIAREDDLAAYLAGAAHDRVVDAGDARYERTPGTRAPARPAAQRFWVASATGAGEQTAEWEVREGRWAVAVMRADAAPGVDADVRAGLKVGWALGLGVGLLAAGLVFAAGGGALLWAGLRRPPGQ